MTDTTTISYRVRFGVTPRARKEANEASPQPTSLARRLALAHHVERLIDDGALTSFAHAARVLRVTRARLSQLMDLALLPLQVQEDILTGQLVESERQLRKLLSNPLME